jgi:phenylalanyl-tRNA synthetase beta chain
VAEKLKLRQDIFLAELELDPLYSFYFHLKQTRRYKPLPRFPAVERDFSLLFKDSGVTFLQIARAIHHLNIPEVSTVEALDLYRGKNLPTGTFSLMIRVTLQSHEGTLTESRISEISAKILHVLEYTFGAQLRAS